jgi:hypothetical protein
MAWGMILKGVSDGYMPAKGVGISDGGCLLEGAFGKLKVHVNRHDRYMGGSRIKYHIRVANIRILFCSYPVASFVSSSIMNDKI